MSDVSLNANLWFAANLTRLMAEKGLNDPRLASYVGVSRQSVNLWRKGGMPSQKRFEAVCVALNCSMDDLLGKPPIHHQPEMLPITVWARRERIPVGRARDLFNLRLLSGESQTGFTILVPTHLHAPPDSKELVLLAKRRPRWVPTFRANFARLVAETKTTRSEISTAAGVRNAAVMHWMHGRTYPEANRLPLIAKALGVSVQELAGRI